MSGLPHVGHDPLAHQFDDLEQQHDADELGMWVFLATEVMFFGGLLLTYTVYRIQHHAAFAAASHELDFLWGTINTVVLLCSSLTMALAVQAATSARQRMLTIYLALTTLLGLAFLAIKGVEYLRKYEHGLMPLFGLPFEWHGASEGPARMFFQLYFLMTGLHAIHMLIGIGILLILLVQSARGKLLGPFATPVRMSGLYWHFVDIVWVWLYPLLYLIGAHAS
jgi:cytochrome c oxidase subunit 3